MTSFLFISDPSVAILWGWCWFTSLHTNSLLKGIFQQLWLWKNKIKISSDALHVPEVLSLEVIPIIFLISSSRFVAWTHQHINLTSYSCRSVWTVGLMRTIMNSDTTTAATHKRQAWSEQARLFVPNLYSGALQTLWGKQTCMFLSCPIFLEIIRKTGKPFFAPPSPSSSPAVPKQGRRR